jgi:hypothetical protein
MYVNVSNLSFYRGNPLLNKFASYSTLIWTIIFTPIFYLVSVMIMLRSADSRSSICFEDKNSCDDPNDLWVDCYLNNVVLWGSGFVFGLCFTYFKLFKLQLNLVPKQMKTWPLINWVIFLVVLGIGIGVVGMSLYYYYTSGVMVHYIALFIFILASLFVPALLLRKSHSLHIHHYTIGMIFLALIAYPFYPLTWLSGVANGWMIEGGTTYAFDPIFNRRKVKHADHKLQKVIPC